MADDKVIEILKRGSRLIHVEVRLGTVESRGRIVKVTTTKGVLVPESEWPDAEATTEVCLAAVEQYEEKHPRAKGGAPAIPDEVPDELVERVKDWVKVSEQGTVYLRGPQATVAAPDSGNFLCVRQRRYGCGETDARREGKEFACYLRRMLAAIVQAELAREDAKGGR